MGRYRQQKSFDKSKELLTSATFLVHFNRSLPILLACDASEYGMRAVLAHHLPDGSEHPVTCASRSLSRAERNYSQLEKEGLASVFGVNRFHAYLLGHHFDLITDLKPLLTLFNEHKPTSLQASARVRWWSLFLLAYEYAVKFRKTAEHSNADALIRVPLSDVPSEPDDNPPELVLLMEHLADASPVTAKQIELWTRQDAILSQVLHYVQHGRPKQVDTALTPYATKSTELSVFNGCVLWGNRVIVPPQGRSAVLQQLHESHMGMCHNYESITSCSTPSMEITFTTMGLYSRRLCGPIFGEELFYSY